MSWDSLGWYASIYLWLFFTGIGIPPCPEEAGILYAAGLTALHDDVHWWGAWPAAGLGIVCADIVLYGAGRLWGRRLFEYRWVKRLVNAERRQRIEARFAGHGLKLLLMARLLPPLRTGVFVTAGAIRYSFLRFVLADLGYAVVGVGLFFFGGAGLIEAIRHAGHWAAYALAGVIVVYGLYRYYRYLKNEKCAWGTGRPSPCWSCRPATPSRPRRRPTDRRSRRPTVGRIFNPSGPQHERIENPSYGP
jgi:membrane protein DedA with SNARE-associated domain